MAELRCRLAGTSHHVDDLGAACFDAGRALVLRPEPDNPFDPNAVAVFDADGAVQAGYVTPLHAPVVADLLDDGVPVTTTVVGEIRNARGHRTGIDVVLRWDD